MTLTYAPESTLRRTDAQNLTVYAKYASDERTFTVCELAQTAEEDVIAAVS